MGKEIERKFLVIGNGWRNHADKGKRINQAYLALIDHLSLRVRTIGKRKAYLTIKGKRSGIRRAEFEYPIPLQDAAALMRLRVGQLIRKRRHIVKIGKQRFEVDVFLGSQKGLVLAELELSTARARFNRPEWLGREVTDDDRYYNANLAQRKRK